MGLLRDLYRRFLLARHLPAHWRLRPGTLDARLFRHVAIDDEYRLPRRFAPDDVVLDVGAHTGSFALAALRRGAGRVICCEPEPDNADLLTANLAPFARAEVRRVAVWDSGGALRLAHSADRRNTGAAQVAACGVEVESVAFDDLVAEAGRVRLVKLDCEGAEWPILLGSRRWADVEAVCGEYHLPPLIEPPAGLPGPTTDLLVATLERHGFRVELAAAPGSRLPLGLFFGQRVRE